MGLCFMVSSLILIDILLINVPLLFFLLFAIKSSTLHFVRLDLVFLCKSGQNKAMMGMW